MAKEMHIERNKGGRVKVPLSACLVEHLERMGYDLQNKAVFSEWIDDGNVILTFKKRVNNENMGQCSRRYKTEANII